MKLKAIRSLVLPILLVLVSGCASRYSPPDTGAVPPSEALIALEWDWGIHVYTGSGRKVLQLPPVSAKSRKIDFLHDEFFETAYGYPRINSDGKSMTAVRYSDVVSYKWNRALVIQSSELVHIDLTTQEMTTVFSPPEGRLISSPVRSPNEKLIAMRLGPHVALVRADSGELLSLVRDVTSNNPLTFVWTDSIMEWDRTGEHLFIYDWPAVVPAQDDSSSDSRGYSGRDIGLVEFETKSVKWLRIGDRWHRKGFKPSRPTESNAEAQSGAAQDNALRELAVTTLVGSRDHPVSMPIWSQDGRYYFYVVHREGWFGKTYLRGYDTIIGETFKVRTLERYLYTK